MSKPLNTFRDKGIAITVWPGKEGNSCTYSIRKTYKDKNSDEWKESKYYFKDDLRILYKLLREALEWSPVNTTSSAPLSEPSFEDEELPF